MTVTVKLDAALEEQLRQRAAGSGRSTSDVIRAALTAYLDTPEAAPNRSAFALGQDLFGRHVGTSSLAQDRKARLAEIWADKHRSRRS